MKTIVITGGIATGKSTVCGFVARMVPKAQIFDCDVQVHDLLTSGPTRDRLVTEFGGQILDSDGEIDRSCLGDLVFSDSTKRNELESIVHPAILEKCLISKEKASSSGSVPLFVADVPLYYQVEFPIEPDAVVVVASSVDDQRDRLAARLGLGIDHERVGKMITAQMPVADKVERAGNIVIWNSGNLETLRQQTRLALDGVETSNG
ncbi:MAG: dephospho-CoA kinase [Verrucomicrobiota bacterium]